MIPVSELRSICQPADLDLCLYRRRLVRRISIYPTWLFIRLGMSANAVSLIKNVIACAGAVLFAPGEPRFALAGALLLQFSFLLDASDGEVARYTGSSATAGGSSSTSWAMPPPGGFSTVPGATPWEPTPVSLQGPSSPAPGWW